jgi:hypothetical protein
MYNIVAEKFSTQIGHKHKYKLVVWNSIQLQFVKHGKSSNAFYIRDSDFVTTKTTHRNESVIFMTITVYYLFAS